MTSDYCIDRVGRYSGLPIGVDVWVYMLGPIHLLFYNSRF